MNVRPVTHEDLEALRTLLAADEERFSGRSSRLGLADVREWVSHADLARDSWLFERNGELCAAGWAFRRPASDVLVAVGAVRPACQGQGVGAELAARVEAAALASGAARIHQNAYERDAAAAALFSGRGYRKVRRFFDMVIELDTRPPAPDVRVETMRDGEERAFHATLEEAFLDHWEHHSWTFDDWWARQSRSPTFDPSLWFLVRADGEIAAAAKNEANRHGGGYVGAIGVRRRWRGRGYAKALLLHTFREFYDRGLRRVTLGVDAENPTGATQLYERVGMHVELEFAVYEKAVAA